MPKKLHSFTILNARCIVDSTGDTQMSLLAMEAVFQVRIDLGCQYQKNI